MQKLGRSLFAALLATILVMSAVAPAAARRFAFRERFLRIVFPAEAKFRAENVRCVVTLEGSFHSKTISKVASALIGFISSAWVDQSTCVGGSIRFLNGTELGFQTLPWHWQYRGFTGTLPNIEGVKTAIIGVGFKVGTCLYRSTAAEPLVTIFELTGSGGVSALRIEEANRLRLNEGFCAPTVAVEGRGRVEGISEEVNVFLVQ